jgi:hypothetical protein
LPLCCFAGQRVTGEQAGAGNGHIMKEIRSILRSSEDYSIPMVC